MNVVFEKGDEPSDFRNSLIKPLYEKDDRSECVNYRDRSLGSVGGK